ncbi:MAG TPA: hypothetical protein P5158_12495 [Chitinophagaceae bacterium]|nr:hypothetical protein [Chitinophagaceae bacterium]MCB9056150.1 hypothetical protein [Chitinophagales bacterium]HRX94937.1 hypothetical protein [Chitinophagaceae bacterium]
MNKLSDLRFVIGLFFLVTGVLLTGYYFISGKEVAEPVNLWCGISFFVFGVFMVLLATMNKISEEPED